MNRVLFVFFVLGSSVLTGCGAGADRPELVPVSGTVTYNGTPIEGATVTFGSSDAAARSPSGVTDSSGKFKLTTFDTNDGAPVGEYVVTIAKFEAAAGAATDMGSSPEKMKEFMAKQTGQMQGAAPVEKAAAKLPAKYAEGTTSGEKRKVVKGETNDFNFTLTD